MALLDRFHRTITRRDDAALPHEVTPDLDDTLPVQGEDDDVDGNSTPNGGI